MSQRGSRNQRDGGRRLPRVNYYESQSQSQEGSQYEPPRQLRRTSLDQTSRRRLSLPPSSASSGLSSVPPSIVFHSQSTPLSSLPSSAVFHSSGSSNHSLPPFTRPQQTPSPIVQRQRIYRFEHTRIDRPPPNPIPAEFTFRYYTTPEQPNISRDPVEALRVLDMLADQMRRTIALACAPHILPGQPYQYARTAGMVLGILILSNRVQASVRAESQFQYLNTLTGNQLVAIIEKMHQSGSDVWIEDLEFRFEIDPRRMRGGGSVSGTPRTLHCGYTNPLYQKTHSSWSDDQGVINCAAYALNFAMNSRHKRYYQKSDDRICADARRLQTELGWGDRVTLEDLPKFVESYPTHRLTCLFTGFKNNILNTWVGERFNDSVFDAERFVNSPHESKVLYLMLDVSNSHYVGIHSPQQLYTHVHHSTMSWCHRCTLAFGTNIAHCCETHLSGERDKPKGKLGKCEFCKVFVKDGKCECAETRCKQCKAKRGRGYDPKHRCIVYKNPEREKKANDFNHGEPPDGSIPCLWAYDFESCTIITETVNEEIDLFETDEDFRYTGRVVSVSKTTNTHKVNYIVAINVFTGDRKTWEGDNGLHDFIMYMATFNNGFNVLYAHNASGYDTRLLFEVAARIPTLSAIMYPILRGGKFMQLKIGNCCYRDSLLHVTGSLKSLTKDFCGDEMMAKGYFPHMFNTESNYGYVGPIPEKKYFDLGFSLRDEQDFETFNTWYTYIMIGMGNGKAGKTGILWMN